MPVRSMGMAALDPIFLTGLVFVSAFGALAYLVWTTYPEARRLVIGLSVVNVGVLLFRIDFGILPDHPTGLFLETVASVAALAWATLVGVGAGITLFAAHEYRQKPEGGATTEVNVDLTS